MAAKGAIHTFQGGMVKDLDKSLVSKESYLEARNFRLTTSVGESTGALENIEGNNVISNTISVGADLIVGHTYLVIIGPITYRESNYNAGDYFAAITDTTSFTGSDTVVLDINEIAPNSMYVCGSINIRNTVVLFLTSNVDATPSAGRSMIVKLTLNEEEEIAIAYEVVYDDSLNNDREVLRFSTANPIRSVGVYESNDIQKIYWCDGYNNVRYANIMSYLTTDGDEYSSGTNYYFSPDLFEFLPRVSMTKPYLDHLYPGTITAGTVQYAFQYYTEHGSETSISPLSDTIHITTDNDYSASSWYYEGEGDTSVLTGKSIKMIFELPEYEKYSHIRIFRLHYTTINSVPTITVVGEIPIQASGYNISFLDTGNSSLGILTLSEFNIGETSLFSAEDMAIKDSRLFVANINNDEFSIGDWDARAVRFNPNLETPAAWVFDSTEDPAYVLPDFSNWSDPTIGYPEYHDGINQFNDPANDGDASKMFKYQSDLTTLGAEGLNITIGFITDEMVIDNGSNDRTFAVTIEDENDNKSYTSFASPYKSGRRSWQRDEVYRLYIIFFDDRGRSSSAKWVCDLRMPSLHDSGYDSLASLSGSDVTTTALYPTVTLKNLPTYAVSAQLLRVERKGDDRSILTQALVLPTDLITGILRPQWLETTIDNAGTYDIVKLVSPEINILKNVSKGAADYLEYVSIFTPQILPYYFTTGTDHTYYKMRQSSIVPYAADVKTSVNDTKYIEPGATDVTFSFHSHTFSNYDSVRHSVGCSGLLVSHINYNWSVDGERYCLANYKRDVHESQYGGQTYEDRSSNIAIPASEMMTRADTEYMAWNGDTFINFFDVTTELFDLTLPFVPTYAPGGSKAEIVYIPVESSINCELRHDVSARKAYPNLYGFLTQETAGKWEDSDGNIYDQTTPLYQYNTVYSQESTAKFYVNIPPSVSTETEFDCMVKVSKKKLNGEAQDSWTIFPIDDFIEVSTNKGPITTLLNVNDKLLFWQDTAFGALSVNDRSLIQDTTGTSLVLGTGGILDRYDYISDNVGATDNQHVVTTQTGVYWLNTRDKSVYRFAQGLQNLSKSKQIQSWLESNLITGNDITVRTVYDIKYNQVLMSFYNIDTEEGCTLVFDERLDTYLGFYDFFTNCFIPYVDGYLTTKHVEGADQLFLHNSQLKERSCFYSMIPGSVTAEINNTVPMFVDSSIKILFNDEYGITKVFDDFAFVSNVTSGEYDLYNDTFSQIRCYNSYQNTDYCYLIYGFNLERDEREWTTNVPRNAVNQLYTINPDIFDAENLDKTRKFRERMRDKYMITDFVYTNTNNRRIVVPYIVIKYRTSYR